MGAPVQPANLDKARALVAGGNYVQAIPLLQEAVAHNPDHFDTQFLLGISHLRNNEAFRAERCFRNAVALESRSHVGHYYLGLALERQGRHSDAQLEYQFALVIKPDYREAAERIRPEPEETAQASPGRDLPPVTARSEISHRPPAASLAQQIATRKDTSVDTTGAQESTGYRRWRSFSGHFLLTVATFLLWVSAAIKVLDPGGPGEEEGLFAAVSAVLIALVFALLYRGRARHYTIYERRIDIKSGLLFKTTCSIWLYEIEKTWIHRSPLNLLTGDAALLVRVVSPGARPEVYKLTGLGNHRRMQQLWMRLRDRAVIERREMKSVWI